MPRIKVVLNKTNLQKINKFLKWAKKEWPNVDNDILTDKFIEYIKDEIKSLKDCSEKMIVEHYVLFFKEYDNKDANTQECIEWMRTKLKDMVRKKLAYVYTNKTHDNVIDIYFNEVKREYILHPQNECDSLEFLPENRDIFIKNNLKLVVNCAKRYQNLGLSFEDLIQAGNEGLLSVFDKFKTDKANLRNAILATIDESPNSSFSYDDAKTIITKAFTYGKLLDNTLKKLPEDGFATKDDFKEWCTMNVKTAAFASVAFQWIRAAIILELSKMGSIVKLPKSNKDGEGSNIAKIIHLDSINPYTEDCYNDDKLSIISNEEFIIEDEAIDNIERQQTFIETVEVLLSNLKPTERTIVKKRFGIGYPYQLTINEIAENENISLNQVKKTLKESMAKLSESLTDKQKELLKEIL